MTLAPTGRRELTAATLGRLVESYDWTIFGLLTPYFAAQMFAGGNGVLLGYLTFAVGFLIRPLGAVLIGRITDTRGRRFGLTLTVGMIAAGSLAIALIPAHEQIGLGAALLLVLARLVQGLSMGGEGAAQSAYIAETAPRGRRYWFGSISYSTDILGNVVGLVTLAVLLGVFGADGVREGAWRYAFALGAVMGLVTLWIRRSAAESPVFLGMTGGPPALPLMRAHLRQMVVVFFVVIGSTISVYFGQIYLPEYAAAAGVITKEAAAGQLGVPMIVLLVLMLVCGRLGDRFGPITMVRWGFVYVAVVTVPLMLGLQHGKIPFIVAATLYTIGAAPALALGPVMGSKLFPPAIRALAGGVPGTLAIALFGGTFLLVAEWLNQNGHLTLIPIYAGAAAVLSAFAVFLIKKSDLYEEET
ncbi:MFS transporter [Nonomuraea sp. NPDC050556]|uniref:MFS transporter n=1 Tax=Nonomuraea sp. NPDC050556 TaxID=3364369 RepID=UPI0037A780AA